jgi:hypothetical protein
MREMRCGGMLISHSLLFLLGSFPHMSTRVWVGFKLIYIKQTRCAACLYNGFTLLTHARTCASFFPNKERHEWLTPFLFSSLPSLVFVPVFLCPAGPTFFLCLQHFGACRCGMNITSSHITKLYPIFLPVRLSFIHRLLEFTHSFVLTGLHPNPHQFLRSFSQCQCRQSNKFIQMSDDKDAWSNLSLFRKVRHPISYDQCSLIWSSHFPHFVHILEKK